MFGMTDDGRMHAIGSGMAIAIGFLFFLTGCAGVQAVKGRITIQNAVLAPNMRIDPLTLAAAPGEEISIANRTSRVLSISFDPDDNPQFPEEDLPAIRPSISPLQNVTFRLNRPGFYVYRVSSEDIVRMATGYGRIIVQDSSGPERR